jgi:hypothetical protein
VSRPITPTWRQLTGVVGSAIHDAHRFIQDALTRDHLWGDHITVTFTAASTPTRITTGMSGPPRGYHVVRSSADVRIWDAKPSTNETDPSVLWLQASAAATVTLYVF